MNAAFMLLGIIGSFLRSLEDRISYFRMVHNFIISCHETTMVISKAVTFYRSKSWDTVRNLNN